MRVDIEDRGQVRRVTVHGPIETMGRVVPCAQFESRYSRSLLEAFVAQRGPHFLNEYERFANPLYVRQRLQRCLARIGREPANTPATLDFGCGTGTISLLLAEMGFTHVTGLEINEGSVALARRRAGEHGFPQEVVKFLAISTGDTSLGDAGYDLVILNAVLEHLTPGERDSLLPALWRALRPGGHLLIHETPNRLFPIDRHTTGLIGLPWLPIGLKKLCARLSGRVPAGIGQTGFYRTGTHGATIFEIRGALPPGEVEDLSGLQDPEQTELTATGRTRRGAEKLLISFLRISLMLLKPVLARFGFAVVHLYPFLLVCLRKTTHPPAPLRGKRMPAAVGDAGSARLTAHGDSR
jgi:SAM-dependent methyltransferase